MMVRTSDIYFAGYLQALGHTITGIEREGTRVRLMFELPDETAEKVRMNWYNSTGSVLAMPYAMALRALKSLVKS